MGVGTTSSTTNSGLGTGGAFDHSFAFWFKINRNITNNDYVVTFGEEANDNMIAVNISGNSLIHFDNWGRGVITGDVVRLGIWYHVACTHTGSATGDINTQLIYVNGIRQTTVSTGTGTLAFTSDRITVGARPGTNNSNTPAAFLDGAVANVRFFKGKVLNAEQVKELYACDASSIRTPREQLCECAQRKPGSWCGRPDVALRGGTRGWCFRVPTESDDCWARDVHGRSRGV